MTQSSFTSSCHVAEAMTLLLEQGRNDRQSKLDKVTAGTALGPEAILLPSRIEGVDTL
jgi:hypothetical protein